MKKITIQAVLLLLVFTLPLALTSISKVSDMKSPYELAQKTPEQQENKEGESDSNEVINDIEGFMANRNYNLAAMTGYFKYFSNGPYFTGIGKDVLTPPPELI